MTAPHDILNGLRVTNGTDQMAIFAEALIEASQAANYGSLPLIAAAYMLGRVDALRPDAPECNGSAGPMASRVLKSKGLLYDETPRPSDDDLPF